MYLSDPNSQLNPVSIQHFPNQPQHNSIEHNQQLHQMDHQREGSAPNTLHQQWSGNILTGQSKNAPQSQVMMEESQHDIEREDEDFVSEQGDQTDQIHFLREYIGCQLQTLSPILTINPAPTFTEVKSKSKTNLNWPQSPKLIPDDSTFYFIKFTQPSIEIYDILPEPKKYILNLSSSETPIAIHVHSRIVYLVLEGGDLLTFLLGSMEVERSHIGELQNVGCVYSIHTIYIEDKKQSLRIAYENGGMRFYELNSYLFNLNFMGAFRHSDFIHLIPVPPYNLIGFVVTTQNQLKPINLYSKQLMDCDPLKLNFINNPQLLNLKFLTSVPEPFQRPGYLTFFMAMFETYSPTLKLFEVRIKQAMESEGILSISDIVNGDVGNEVSIRLLTTFSDTKLIQDVVMTESGFYVSYRQNHNSPILKTLFRFYTDLIALHPIEMIESQLFKAYKEDSIFTTPEDVETIRQRILNPHIFTLPFLKANGLDPVEIHSKLAGKTFQELKILLNRLVTARWPQAYKFVGLVNMHGVNFVVRDNSISLLAKNGYGLEEFQKMYYETEVEAFERLESKNLVDDMRELSIQSKLSVANRKAQKGNQSRIPIEYCNLLEVSKQLQGPVQLPTSKQQAYERNEGGDDEFEEIRPFNYHDLRSQEPREGSEQEMINIWGTHRVGRSLFHKLLLALQGLFTYISQYNEIHNTDQSSTPSSIVKNVTISQVRHTIKVAATLLFKYYPQFKYNHEKIPITNDRQIIMSLLALNKIIHTPYVLYHSFFYPSDSLDHLHYDIITVLVDNQTRNQRSFNFGSFESHDYVKILQLVINRDFEFETRRDKKDILALLNNSSELLKYIVRQSQKHNALMKKYTQIIYQGGYTNITQYHLKICLLTENYQEFSRKILALISTQELSCKFLKEIFLKQNEYYLYRKGRAIVEYLSLACGEKKVLPEDLNFYLEEFKDLINALCEVCDRQENHESVKERLGYLDRMDSVQRYHEFVENSELIAMKKEFAYENSPMRIYGLSYELLLKHCRVFNEIAEMEFKDDSLVKFLTEMFNNYRWGLEVFKNKQNPKAKRSKKGMLGFGEYNVDEIEEECDDLIEESKQLQLEEQINGRGNVARFSGSVDNGNEERSSQNQLLLPNFNQSEIRSKTPSEVRRLIESEDQKSEESDNNQEIHGGKNKQYEDWQSLMKFERKYISGFQQLIYGRVPTYCLLFIIKQAHLEAKATKILEWDKLPFYFLKRFVEEALDTINLEIRKLLRYFPEPVVVRNLIAACDTCRIYVEVDQLKTLNGYLSLDYCSRLRKTDKISSLLTIIQNEGKLYRSAEYESYMLSK